VYAIAPEKTRFSKLPAWVTLVNSLASLAFYGLFLASLVVLCDRLPVPPWICWVLSFVTGVLFLGKWRRTLAAMVGTTLIAIGSVVDEPVMVALGAVNIGTWLLIALEQREFRRVWTFKPIRLDSINTGSARVLQGKVRIWHVFLDTPRCCWRQRRRLSALGQVDRACRWMVRAASVYRVPLEFVHHIVNTQPVSYSGEIPTAANRYAESAAFEEFLSTVIREEQGRRDDQSRNDLTRDSCLVVHLAEDIGYQAYAMPRHRGQSGGHLDIEYTVVGARRSASLYAHELLHLFGAYDLQFSSHSDTASSRKWDEVRRTLLGRSIMFDVDGPLRQFAIDEQTAQCIGWM
jgi:hypothetical protein